MRAYMKTVKGREGAKPAAWTLAAHLNLVKGLFNYAVKHRIIKSDDNPTSVIDAIDTNSAAEPEVMTCDEVVLVNFKPDGDNGSYKWQKHDWHYEAEYYRKHEVPIRIQV